MTQPSVSEKFSSSTLSHSTRTQSMRAPAGITLLLGALTALTALAIDISLPALPLLQEAFAADVKSVQLTLSIFLVGFAVGQFICGPVSDHYGRRPIILAGLVLYVAAGVACSMSTSLATLVAFRFLQGVGASVGPILSRAIVRDLFDARSGSAILSHITQVMVLAPMIAPTIGAQLLRWFNWPAVFVVLAVVGLGVTIASWARLPETITRKQGHVQFGTAIRSYGEVFRNRTTLRYVLAICFTHAGLFAYVSSSPFVLMEVFGVKRENFGYVFAVPALALMVGASVNRRLLRTHPPGRVLQGGIYLLLAAGACILVATAFHGGLSLSVVVPMAIYLFAMAVVMPNATMAALARHGAIAGAASSVIGAVQTLFSSVSAFVVGVFYNHSSWSFAIVMAMSAGLTAAICRCEPKTPPNPAETPVEPPTAMP